MSRNEYNPGAWHLKVSVHNWDEIEMNFHVDPSISVWHSSAAFVGKYFGKRALSGMNYFLGFIGGIDLHHIAFRIFHSRIGQR